MAKKEDKKIKNEVVGSKRSAGGKKGIPKKDKKVTKGDLVEQIRKHKKGMQEMRFGLSKEVQQKGGSHKNLRKEVARVATRLTVMRKGGAIDR